MIRFRLAELMERRRFETGRRLTIGEVAEATGLNRMTLSKILNHRGYSTGTDTVDRLCAYFDCRVEDVMEYVQTQKEVTETARNAE